MKSAEELRAMNKNREITQLCYVTDDYKKMIEFLTEKFEWGPWDILSNTPETATDVFFNGEPLKDWLHYFAVTQIGDLQIEVIQPVKSPNPYDKFLKEKGPGLHHFKESIRGDDDKLRARIKQFEDLGNYTFSCGLFGDDIYNYFDTYKDLGSYYEMGNSAVNDTDLSTWPGYIGQYPEK